MSTSRIFIGGIPPGTTNEELVQRFKSFGDVKSCEVVPDKQYPGLLPTSEPMIFNRNFGFITIEPKDEKSLQRAIAVYNGSLWRGCTLRCKLAKPTAMELLAEERKEEEEKGNEEVSL
jgi:RNA recognition motif-containing protein